ncbi:hypothetical protein [Candidatus Methanoperedens sp. BLZ2]|nr:hypothetical protein [Candidatus Methanoperedens sp. BLZ2]KAB2941698.1 MAG: hypothetical protein F9K14_18035 [Candidatus Methanoperedens sp.]MBZ0174808.1 hypothetical protein [Candidatus Methanoperedens nitroreducens]
MAVNEVVLYLEGIGKAAAEQRLKTATEQVLKSLEEVLKKVKGHQSSKKVSQQTEESLKKMMDILCKLDKA